VTHNSTSFTNQRTPIIIDTDLSFDDYVALLYLLQHSVADVRAIVVSNGVAHVRPGLGNIGRLLTLFPLLNIPFAGGPDHPLSGQNEFPNSWRILMDYAIRLLLPWRKVAPSPLDAPALLRQTIKATPIPVTLVALAPLTTIALALQSDPSLADRIANIVISGGDFALPGTPHADPWNDPHEEKDFNYYLDPLAMKIVLESGVRVSFVPLSLTHDGNAPLLFSKTMVQCMRRSARGRAMRLLVRLVYLWQVSSPQFVSTPVWDGVVAALAIDPSLGSWHDVSIEMLPHPPLFAESLIRRKPSSARIQVCVEGNLKAFEESYISVVSSASGNSEIPNQKRPG
jgi:inosine-uridine nucleoside N-ribohydrolase